MSKGKTKSRLTLSERREEAHKLFSRGFTDTDVARKLRVSRTTASSYRAHYEQSIKDRVADQPDVLRDVLGNTLRQLGEFDDIRKIAWENLQRKKAEIVVVCESCGEETEYVYQMPPTDQATVQYQNVLIKAAEARAKLLGLLGVKQEVFIEIQNVSIVQNKIMAWMVENLQGEVREQLASFIEVELAPYIHGSTEDRPTPVLDASVLTSLAGPSEPIPADALA